MSAVEECSTCKKRRVRCDGAKPNCVRCQKAHRMCIFPDATAKTFTFIGHEGPRTKSTSQKGTQLQIKAIKDGNRANNLDTVQPKSLTKALVPSLVDQATAFYFHTHHDGIPDLIEPAQEHSALLPQAFTRSSSTSALRLALLAQSHATFGKAKGAAFINQESRRLYTQAVGKIQQSLTNPLEAASDEVLLAAMVLSSYESTASFKIDGNGLAPRAELSQRMLQGFRHHDGAMALLRLRRQHPAEPTDLNLDKLVRRQLLRSALLRGRGIPDFLEFGEYFGESGVLLGLDRHMAQLIKGQRYTGLMRNYYQVALAKGQPLNKAPLYALIHEAQRLDSDMLAWEEKLDRQWHYTSLPPSDNLGRNGLPRIEIHSYQSPGHAAIWNRHRAVRIIGKQVTIDLLRLAAEFFNDDVGTSIRSIAGGVHELIDEICASLALTSTSVDNLQAISKPDRNVEAEELLNVTMLAHLAFPLHAVINALPLTDIPLAQEQLIRSHLLQVGKIGNDAILEQVALHQNSSNTV